MNVKDSDETELRAAPLRRRRRQPCLRLSRCGFRIPLPTFKKHVRSLDITRPIENGE